MKIIYQRLILVVCIAMLFLTTSCVKNPENNNHQTPLVHECESVCETCGKCTDSACNDEKCKQKCDADHINLPDIDVDDLK